MKQIIRLSWFHTQRALRASGEAFLLFFVPRRLSATTPVVFQCKPPFRATVEDVLDRQERAGVENDSIRSARALVLGVGAIGSKVALVLAQMGFGELELIDGDTIEKSNIARGFLFKDSIGELKVVATARALAKGTASGSTVRAWRDQFQKVVPHIERQGQVTVILALLDNDGSRQDAARLAQQWQVPLIVTGLDAVTGSGGYALYWDPSQHASRGCAQCFVGAQPPVQPAKPEGVDSQVESLPVAPCAASRADVIALIAARAAWFAVSIAQGKHPGHRLERIFQTGRIERSEHVERVPNCSLCGAPEHRAQESPGPARGAQRPDPTRGAADESNPEGGGFTVL